MKLYQTYMTRKILIYEGEGNDNYIERRQECCCCRWAPPSSRKPPLLRPKWWGRFLLSPLSLRKYQPDYSRGGRGKGKADPQIERDPASQLSDGQAERGENFIKSAKGRGARRKIVYQMRWPFARERIHNKRDKHRSTGNSLGPTMRCSRVSGRLPDSSTPLNLINNYKASDIDLNQLCQPSLIVHRIYLRPSLTGINIF